MTIRANRQLSRREFGVLAGAVLCSTRAAAQGEASILDRPLPGGERIPAVGLGTAYVFDTNNEATRSRADAVIRALLNDGGRLIDTASTYGEAEGVLGDVMAAAGLRNKLFIATKIETPDPQELKRSLARLKVSSVDLLQLHNVSSKRQSLASFREWKQQGICRYIGITSTFHQDYPAVEAVLAREKPDFVQIGYSIEDREAEKAILPLAGEIKACVLTAEPYGSGRLFRAVQGKQLPDWARPFANSWGQFFLKFLLADPRVTAVIPRTSNPAHMADNAGAMRGPLPDPEQRRRMVRFVEAL
jgi:aryl-alcohol dehydrogenase-like predicted oxidoreductase